MERSPTFIVSSVIRSSHQGQSHGGVYPVDLADGDRERVIDWSGRGLDQGLWEKSRRRVVTRR